MSFEYKEINNGEKKICGVFFGNDLYKKSAPIILDEIKKEISVVSDMYNVEAMDLMTKSYALSHREEHDLSSEEEWDMSGEEVCHISYNNGYKKTCSASIFYVEI